MIKWLTTALIAVLLAGQESTTHALIEKPDNGHDKVCRTEWFDRDDPTVFGDFETLNALHIEFPGRICKNPLKIEVETLSGHSVESTGNVIEVIDTVKGFICKNSDQKHCQKCHDFRVRFICPDIFCNPPACWTDYFDRDNPTGSGDWETLDHLNSDYPGKICMNPLAIEVLTTYGKTVASTGNVIYVSDAVTGFVCKNSEQPKGKKCQDFKVRFQCHHSFCYPLNEPVVCWTKWFSRDDPLGTGDWETLFDLRKENPNAICEFPIQIDVQTVNGLSVDSTGDVIYVSDTKKGFVCRNYDQKQGVCSNYRVRFLCSLDFCRPKDPGCYTQWFDRDDPSGYGDYEILPALRHENPGKICDYPLEIEVLTLTGLTVEETENFIVVSDVTTGLICKNNLTDGTCHDFRVRFKCPEEFCNQEVCWTQWFDRDDATGTGDWELLDDLRDEYPNVICDTPLLIEVVSVDKEIPFDTSTKIAYKNNPSEGFACRNYDQKEGIQCCDYKVRFGCPCPCKH